MRILQAKTAEDERIMARHEDDIAEIPPSPAVASEHIESTAYTAPTVESTGGAGRDTNANPHKLWLADEVEFTSKWKHSLGAVQRRAEQVDDYEASFGQEFASAMALNNPIMSAIVQAPMADFPIVDDYSPFDEGEDGLTGIDGYEQNWKVFVDSTSPEMTSVLMQRIDDENHHREILAQGGASGVIASVASGLTDPINLALIAMPLTAEMGVAKVVGAGLVATSVSEGILHATQETRTMEETALNLAATAIFDGAIAGLAVSVSKGQREILTSQIEEAISTSVGAAERTHVAGESASGNVIKKGIGANMAARLALITPLGRTLQSSEKSVRALVQDMVESGIHVQGDFVPTAVESLIKLDYAKWSQAQMGVRGLEKKFMKDTGMDKRAFNEQLDAAMRRGDLSDNAIVQQAAQKLRTVIDDKWTRAAELQIQGTYTKVKGADGAEDTIQPIRSETAPSYMTRRYDMNQVRANPENFKKAWIEGMKDQHARGGEVPTDFGTKGLPLESRYYEVADSIYESVYNLKVGDAHFDVGASGGKVFKQKLDVRDEYLEGFLVKDWEATMDGYMKSMAPRIRLAEKFGDETGDFMMSRAIKKVNDSFNRRIRAMDKKISDPSTSAKDKKALHKQKDKLTKEQTHQIRDIEVMRDRLLNTTQEPSMMNPENRGILSALRAARSWNIATSLSNVVISSIPDMARLITHGRFSALGKAFQKSVFSKDLLRRNLPKEDMAKMASAFERAASYRMQQLAEVEDGVVHTGFDKQAHKMADAVITFSGMKHWNSVMKTVSGHLIGDSMAMAAKKGNNKALKMLGLNDARIKDFRKAIDEHAIEEDGLWNLNLDRWTDRDLVEIVEAASVKEADRLIVTPSVGDKPLFATTEVGRTLFQFKSFILAATNKVMLPLLQEGGVRPWMEVATSVGLGLAIANMKASIRGDVIEPKDQMQEAIAATGLTGYAMELYRLGFEKDSLRRGADGVMGPTIGLANNAMTLGSAALGAIREPFGGEEGASPEQTAKALRRMTPFQNSYVLNKGFDVVEEATAKALGGSSGVKF